jgi:hypothetical protein
MGHTLSANVKVFMKPLHQTRAPASKHFSLLTFHFFSVCIISMVLQGRTLLPVRSNHHCNTTSLPAKTGKHACFQGFACWCVLWFL